VGTAGGLLHCWGHFVSLALRRFLIGKRIALVDRDVRGTPDAERKESRWRSVAPLPGQRRDVLV
jgi:hypothetical protein